MRKIKVNGVDMRIHSDNLMNSFSVTLAHVYQCIHVFEAIISVFPHIALCDRDHGCVDNFVKFWVSCCIRPEIVNIATRILEIIAAMKHKLMEMVPSECQSNMCLHNSEGSEAQVTNVLPRFSWYV